MRARKTVFMMQLREPESIHRPRHATSLFSTSTLASPGGRDTASGVGWNQTSVQRPPWRGILSGDHAPPPGLTRMDGARDLRG